MNVFQPVVERITVYPFKSLDGKEVASSGFSPGGTLAYDRAFALFDEAGNLINGKSDSSVHRLSARFEASFRTILLSHRFSEESGTTFDITQDHPQLEDFFSEYFGKKVVLKRAVENGFPDDPVQSHVTIVSTASLQAVATHFGFTLDECRNRFRANIEIGGVPAFWEERLVLPRKHPVPFRIGQAGFIGVKPCPRCIVPSRHPQTGEIRSGFQKELAEWRKGTLPDWSPLPSYGNYYQLSVSCRSDLPHNLNANVSVGDSLVLE
ncbi:MAG: hypothetical protein RL021_491 [Bacteroidota bacterium]